MPQVLTTDEAYGSSPGSRQETELIGHNDVEAAMIYCLVFFFVSASS
jgi:hypothetical protein